MITFHWYCVPLFCFVLLVIFSFGQHELSYSKSSRILTVARPADANDVDVDWDDVSDKEAL